MSTRRGASGAMDNASDYVCLGNEQNQSVIFEIASKYCISDSFVDHNGYSISSKEFLPTVVDIMVI